MGSGVNHYRIVEASLDGRRQVDEQTFSSLAMLEERLEGLKKYDDIFAGVAFSPDVSELLSRHGTVPVG